MTLNLKTSRLLSIAVAFVAPLAISTLPAQAQESTDKPNFGTERTLPPAQMPDASRGDDMNVAMALPGSASMDSSADAGMMDMGARFLKGDVAVTNEQYEKLYQLRNEFLDKMGPKMAEVFSLKRHLKDALTSADIDNSKVADLRSKITSAVQDMANLKIDHEIATMKVYTPAQRTHLRLAMMKCPGLNGMGHHMRGHHMHGGMGMHRGHGEWGKGECGKGRHEGGGHHEGGEHRHGGWQPKEGGGHHEGGEHRHGGWQPKDSDNK